MTYIYTCLNGRFLRAERAALPVTDRGFRFGDGVFETIRLEDGVPYQWPLHMARMEAGLHALRITTPPMDWAFYAKKMIEKNKAREGFLRIAISRGSGSRGYAPYPASMPISWVIEYLPPLPPPESAMALWLSSMARVPLQSLPTNHKIAQGLGSTLALMEAHDHGCDEALQLTTHGFLCETASANLFWYHDQTLYTPSLDLGCLNGTTRDAVFRISPVQTRAVHAGIADLEKADAVFICNTRLGIWPIHAIQPMGWHYATNHPLMQALRDLFIRDRVRDSQQHASLW
jgi:4-amino-4-deoxychorismate lyase